MTRRYLSLAFLSALCQQIHAQATCEGDFSEISAASYIASLSPGWNLGNSLDSFPGETDWNNPLVVEAFFDSAQDAGFKSVRIPVTWAYHFTGSSNEGDSPDWTVDTNWLQRVSDVVSMATDRDLYAIVNVHHDSALWANVTPEGANLTMIEEKFYRLWYQIGTKLGCSPSTVAFEPLNEPPGSTAEHAAELNKLNNIFLQAINDAGGFNSQRVVTLVGPGEDIIRTSLWFERPDAAFSNPYALQVHYYSPYAFTSAAWGKTIWGSDEDRAALDVDFAQLRGNFSDIPVVIGEWLVSPVFSEPTARWRYYDFIGRTAASYEFATMIWDNGNDHLDRSSLTWRDETSLHIHANSLAGISNSLPDSTTDAYTTSQSSSAFIFHHVGDEIGPYTLGFQLNSNTVVSVSEASSNLVQGTDYSIDGSNIIFSSSFLSRYFSTSDPGIKATLSISFSFGSSIPVQLVQWDVPTVPTDNSQAIEGADLPISIHWQGIEKPAAVAAYKADGSYLVDEWTVYLGPLEQGRTTFGGQWLWSWNQDGVTITSGAVSAVVSGGQTTTFVIDAFPRVPGNSVNYTLIV